jgi:lipopolysaccharide export system permease protein
LTIDSASAQRRKSFLLMRVLDKMIVQDLLKTLASVLSAIVIIVVSRNFISILKLAINGQLAKDTLFHYFSLKMIVVSINLLPVSTFIAILLIMGRMYRDLEMTAMSATGAGIGTIYRSLYIVVVPLFVLSSFLALFAAPWAEAQMKLLIKKDAQTADIRGITAGRFTEYSHGDLVVYVQKLSQDKRLEGIFVQDRQHGQLSVVNAESGSIKDLDDGRYIVLNKGQRVQGTPGLANIVIEQFEEYAVKIEKQTPYIPLSLETVASPILWASGRSADIVELQRRIAIPFGIMILTFLAVPLAKMNPRGGIYGNIFLSFLIYFSYENIRKVVHSWIIKGKLMEWPGFFGVYGLLLIIGVGFIVKLYGWRWFALNLKRMGQLK